ncbi:hypothetical protein KO353_04445 [Elioraea tepida]|uniref:Uncharacterized protein n=1 Tax=Elioraea tepida TaxID=2843330 RepID=A0A975U4B4_9PROT|nr:hypothetical protein [Elioraea tepida]QXM25483.1 hypothetical protein KO353_04445 [Elioraea tepida]
MPVILASDPNAEECRSALVLVRLNPAAKRYAVEPVGVTDAGFAARLAREAVAAAFEGGADWTRVRPGDLVPPEPAAPKRVDPATVRPGHPAWARLVEETFAVGASMIPPEERAATRERLVAEALARGWSPVDLGKQILREAAERQDATHIDPRWHRSAPDPIALATGTQPDPATLWSRVTRAPRQGETTLAERQRAGF